MIRSGLRGRLKAIGEAAAVGSGAAALSRWVRRRDFLILLYHDIVPHGGQPRGERSLHLPQQTFARQLDVLRLTHDVLPLSEVLQGREGTRRPSVAITFDDAYSGAVTAGVEELAKRQLPATIFVTPGILGSTVWWDELADPETGYLEAHIRERALRVCGGEHDRVRAMFGGDAAQRSALPSCATVSQLRSATTVPGIDIAAHSWSHPNLTALPEPRLSEELVRPLTWLRDQFENAKAWLAYPYGLVDEGVAAAAQAVGYEAAFLAEGGFGDFASLPAQRWKLPRLNVSSGLSMRGFTLVTAGVRGR